MITIYRLTVKLFLLSTEDVWLDYDKEQLKVSSVLFKDILGKFWSDSNVATLLLV